uniref:Uncharacterized protein n=1 Tax=Leersia perrieri TaxID=77586 RepID=A0A0D9VT96_9ORYZ
MEDDALVAEAMQRRLDAVPPGPDDPYTIFRLPAAVRERHRDLYEPKVVSVGPYYHGRDGLGSAQRHKWRLLRDFLSRNENDNDKASSGAGGLGAYVRAARAVEAEARRCYAEGFDDMGVDQFAEMLVLDGCFLLEFFMRKSEGQLASPGGAKWAWQHMYHDVLLLENQIPFFVVEALHGVAFAGRGEDGTTDGDDVRDALLDIFCKAFAGDLPSSRVIRPARDRTIHHLLHLHYECNVRNPASDGDKAGSNNGASSLAVWKQPPVPSPRSGGGDVGAVKGRMTSMIPPAGKMEEAGVTFKRKATPRDVFDVSFRYGVLHMPAFVVDEVAKVLIANLVAFEQGGGRAARRLDGGNLVTGFVALVGSLVNSRRDVEVLRRSGILHCMITDEEAVAYFSHVVQYTSMDYDRHLLACLLRDIREHCHWNR